MRSNARQPAGGSSVAACDALTLVSSAYRIEMGNVEHNKNNKKSTEPPYNQITSDSSSIRFRLSKLRNKYEGGFAHLGHGPGNREKGLLLQQPLVHRRHVGLDMELICLALGTLGLAQAEVMVGPPVVGYASKTKQTKAERTDERNRTWDVGNELWSERRLGSGSSQRGTRHHMKSKLGPLATHRTRKHLHATTAPRRGKRVQS